VVIEKIVDGRSSIVDKFGKTIGEATNNVAEYTAVAAALNAVAAALNAGKREAGESPDIEIFSDSTLIVNQLNGLFKIKDPTLRSLVTDIRILEQQTGGQVSYSPIPRQQNRRADFLVNQALDNA
jgi:ribonuclease HI